MESKQAFSDVSARSLPMSRNEVSLFLAGADSNKKSFSSTELDILEQLKGEFHEELSKLSVKTSKQHHEKHLLRWREGEHQTYIDFDFAQRFDVKRGDQFEKPERTSHTTMGGIIRGKLGSYLNFYVHAQNRLDRGTGITHENFDPRQGAPLTISGKNVFSDESWAYLTLANAWFQAEFGRDQLKWGPGQRGSLMLSRENPPFEMLKLKLRFNRFQFTSFHGALHTGDIAKYLAGHRLDIKLFRWMFLGGAEAVVYGNRDVEWSYLNPIMPYHVAEHHLGDKDNNTMSFDMTLFPKRNHKIYFELFLDDFTTAENPFTYYGNKFGIITGHQWINPLGLTDTELCMEYTRIEPYVYTHKDSVNTYLNYNQSIGHWLGPNSDDLFISFSWLLSRDLTIVLSGEKIRHGEGDIFTPHTVDDGVRKKFLSETNQNSWSFGMNIRDQLFRDV
ncbi:hypothetical protein JW979_07965, partial [bacterium]|nr:hypothetical protein [candidate division CSSED10-310 bacterium]